MPCMGDAAPHHVTLPGPRSHEHTQSTALTTSAFNFQEAWQSNLSWLLASVQGIQELLNFINTMYLARLFNSLASGAHLVALLYTVTNVPPVPSFHETSPPSSRSAVPHRLSHHFGTRIGNSQDRDKRPGYLHNRTRST
jgi:hypothetical protein